MKEGLAQSQKELAENRKEKEEEVLIKETNDWPMGIIDMSPLFPDWKKPKVVGENKALKSLEKGESAGIRYFFDTSGGKLKSSIPGHSNIPKPTSLQENDPKYWKDLEKDPRCPFASVQERKFARQGNNF